MPSVSVIIPSYNCAQFLPYALKSVLEQTLTDLEIIIVDDGSTDNTMEIVRPYLEENRVQYVYQENRGLPAARNRGVAAARGKFIAALDADDILAQTALEEMRRSLWQANASWCVTDVLKFWDAYEETQRTEIPFHDLRLGILQDDFIRRGMFLRKSALERVGLWDAAMRMREDWDLNIRLIAAREPFVYLPKALYKYRKRPGSITTGDPRPLLSYTERLLRKHHKRLADSGDSKVAKIYAAHMWNLARQHLYKSRNLLKAVSCVRESLAYDLSLSRLFHPLLYNLSKLTHLS